RSAGAGPCASPLSLRERQPGSPLPATQCNNPRTPWKGPLGKLPRMIFLASQSPRRRELLAQLGVEFHALDVQVPEQRRPGESAEDYVARVAREKAAAGQA